MDSPAARKLKHEPGAVEHGPEGGGLFAAAPDPDGLAIAQIDIAKGGPLTIPTQGAVQPAPPVDLTVEVTEFLKFVVPILNQYQDSHGECPPPEVPPHIAEAELWPFFLKQRHQIRKDKWNSSKDAGYDIGMERAIREWLQRNYLVWAPEEIEDEEPKPSAESAPPS